MTHKLPHMYLSFGNLPRINITIQSTAKLNYLSNMHD
jgi:hypothetical protein